MDDVFELGPVHLRTDACIVQPADTELLQIRQELAKAKAPPRPHGIYRL